MPLHARCAVACRAPDGVSIRTGAAVISETRSGRSAAVDPDAHLGRRTAIRDPETPLRAPHAAACHARGAVSDREGRMPLDHANASTGGQAHTRLRSPHALSMRRTGGQYFVRTSVCTG